MTETTSTDSLATIINNGPEPKLCKYAKLKSTLDPIAADEIDAEGDYGYIWNPQKLEELLRKFGYRVSNDTIAAHRRKMCGCSDTAVV